MSLETIQMEAQVRVAPVTSVDEAKRSIDVTWTTGAIVRRMLWRENVGYAPYDEELLVTREAVDLTRLNAGAPVVDSHALYSTRSQVAVVDNAWIAKGEGLATLRFPPAGVDEAADRMWGMVFNKIICNLSAGYRLQEVEWTDPVKRGEVGKMKVTRWAPFELSFVTVPADVGAQTRSEQKRDAFPVLIRRQDGASAALARMRMRARHLAG
jgi:hypothetical protein